MHRDIGSGMHAFGVSMGRMGRDTARELENLDLPFMEDWGMTRERRHRRRHRGVRSTLGGLFTTGFILLGLGFAFLAQRFGFATLDPEKIWPAIMLVVGFGFLLSVPFGQAVGKVIPGTINVLLGAFFLLITAGPLEWSQIGALWPVFPLVVGIAFGMAFLASLGRQPSLLAPAFICFSVGIIGLAFTLTPLGSLFAFLGWPAILLAVGAAFLLGGTLRLVLRTFSFLARS